MYTPGGRKGGSILPEEGTVEVYSQRKERWKYIYSGGSRDYIKRKPGKKGRGNTVEGREEKAR